jgi:hypothetical protein
VLLSFSCLCSSRSDFPCSSLPTDRDASLSAILEKLRRAAQLYANNIELEQLWSFYQSLSCQASKDSYAQRVDLQDTVAGFLAANSQRHAVCLLLGDAGTGKTTFGAMLLMQLWQTFSIRNPDAIVPIRIDLKQYTKDTAKDCVADTLRTTCHLTLAEIEQLKTSSLRFLFIFDGYDELAGGGYLNLFRSNKLDSWPAGTNAIISCRPEYLAPLKGSHTDIMAPAGDMQRALQEWYVSPLSRAQIEAYLRNPPSDVTQNATDLSSFVSTSPYLYDLISTPFLLRVFCSAFPQLAARGSKNTRITRATFTRRSCRRGLRTNAESLSTARA